MKKKTFRVRYLIAGFFIFYVGYVLISQQFMISRLNKEITTYNSQLNDIERSNKDLRDKIEFAKTEEYDERMAREKIGLVKPGETIYTLNESE